MGGDWYDAFLLQDGRIGITIGDVTGHGLDGAMRMVRMRETLRAALEFYEGKPNEALAFFEHRGNRFGNNCERARRRYGMRDGGTNIFMRGSSSTALSIKRASALFKWRGHSRRSVTRCTLRFAFT